MDKLKGLIAQTYEDGRFLARTIQARGAKRYSRALVIAGVVLLASYKMVFVDGGQKLVRVEHDLAAARATAQFASAYVDLDGALRSFALRLPPVDRAEGWLLDTVRESMKAEGLVAQSLSPVQITEAPNYKILSLNLTFQAKFKQVANWIARMEGSRQLLHVSSLSISKTSDEVGMNQVTVTVGSVVPAGGRP